MVASNEPMYDSINKIKPCLCVFRVTKAIWCSSGLSDRPFTFCRQDRVKYETDSCHFVSALLWLESKVQLVWMWPCSHPQGLSPESTRFIAEHLIGSSCNSQKANEIFYNLSSCNTRNINDLVSGSNFT